MASRNKSLPTLFFTALLFLAASTPARENPERGEWDLVLYTGKYTETTLVSILASQKTKYRDSYIFSGGLNYLMGTDIRPWTFETEGMLVAHFGIMKHLEVSGMLLARARLSRRLPLTFAFGEGLSLAARRPDLESPDPNFAELRFRKQKTNRLLNYLMVELSWSLAGGPRHPRVFMRVHHRSGIYGTYCPPVCGSNFIAYGMKFSL